ncbi:MAG: hypothetical protein H6978_01335 [Gammaproteobacteria bacterium]|nr:hypothetical protein [Gammaproteobacteria bacterium]
MKRYYRLHRVRIVRAPVYVHWTVPVAALLIAVLGWQQPVHAAVFVCAYLAVIVIHETGHAIVASRCGLEVERIDLGWLHGRCYFEAPADEWHDILISWGGVAAQLAIAITVLIAAWAWPGEKFGYAGPVIVVMGYINIAIALTNLAPVPGMDGFTAWRLVPLVRQWNQARKAVNAWLRRSRRR